MSPASIQPAPAPTSEGIAGRLAAASGALLLILAFAVGLLDAVGLVSRYGFRQALRGLELQDEIARHLGYGMAAASVLALPAALVAPFARAGDQRSHSALALVPGCLIGLAVAIVGIAATVATERSTSLMFVAEAAASFGNYEVLSFPLLIACAAIIGGARTPEATAAVATPIILAALIPLVCALSGEPIGGPFDLVAVVAALIAGVVTAAFYAVAPARAVTPWVLGWVLVLAFEFFIASGLFTPTETAGLFALIGVIIALPLRRLVLRESLAPMLRQLGTETIAIMSCLAAMLFVLTPLTKSGLPDRLVEAAAPGIATIVLLAAGYAVLAYLLTPLLTLALMPFAFPLLQRAGLDSVSTGALLLLLGAAAVIARAGRSRADRLAPGLSRSAAWGLAALLVGLAIAAAVVVEPIWPFR